MAISSSQATRRLPWWWTVERQLRRYNHPTAGRFLLWPRRSAVSGEIGWRQPDIRRVFRVGCAVL